MSYRLKIHLLLLFFLLPAIVFGLNSFKQPTTAAIPQASVLPIPTPKTELDSDILWSLIQSWRQSEGLKPYIKDQRLCEIAKDRADDGLDYHKGLLEKYSNYPYPLSENANYYYTSEQDSLHGWLSSPPHRKALENNWTYSCIATFGTTAVQIFSNF